MNWQQFLPMMIVLGVAVGFVWWSSSRKHDHGCNCGCAHDGHEGEQKQKTGN